MLNLQMKMEKAAKWKGKAPLPSATKPSWRLLDKLKPSSKYLFHVYLNVIIQFIFPEMIYFFFFFNCINVFWDVSLIYVNN